MSSGLLLNRSDGDCSREPLPLATRRSCGALYFSTEMKLGQRERTLTNLYNARPQWLADAHRDLDAAVAAAYGGPSDISEEDALAKLLEFNLARATIDNVPADEKTASNTEDGE
jgi:hypothetical protein